MSAQDVCYSSKLHSLEWVYLMQFLLRLFSTCYEHSRSIYGDRSINMSEQRWKGRGICLILKSKTWFHTFFFVLLKRKLSEIEMEWFYSHRINLNTLTSEYTIELQPCQNVKWGNGVATKQSKNKLTICNMIWLHWKGLYLS